MAGAAREPRAPSPTVTGVVAERAGAVLVAGGPASVAYAVYLEMIRAVPVSWWDLALVLAPAGVLAIMGGLVLLT